MTQTDDVLPEEIRRKKRNKASLEWKWRNIERVRLTQRIQSAKKRSKDREGFNKKRRDYLANSPTAKMRNLLRLAKKRAENKNIDFDISVEDLIFNTTCPLLSIPINYGVSGRCAMDESPSIDRIDNSKGYVKGNVWIVSWRANRIKSNASLEELKLITKNLDRKAREIGKK